MRVLAADTATAYCSVALCECGEPDAHVISETTVHAGRRHSEILLTLTRDLLGVARVRLADVDLLAISVGPGSFTGLRVGVASWKGLAFGTKAPLVGVPTLSAMARRMGPGAGIVAPVLDARMQEVFAAAYDVSSGMPKVVMEEMVVGIGELLEQLPDNALVFGDGVLRYRPDVEAHPKRFRIAPAQFHHPSAAAVAFEAHARLAKGASTDASTVVPMYLRKSQAEELRASEAPAG